jgi:gentisate 1,2-dioxygenase
MTAEVSTATSEAFHERMHANHMYGLWELASQMTAQPMPKMLPYMWPWSVVEPIVRESCEVVPVGNERRALQLFNPGLGGRWASTNTLIAAVQVLLPGETARAHRHTPTAIRFIMEGSGAYTAVDGERVYMEPGDFILTPSWAWHDHGNDAGEPVVWLDGLDIPLVQSLEAMFFQLYDLPQVPVTKPPALSARLHGHASLAPAWVKEKTASSPLLLYPWTRTYEALMALSDTEGSPYEGIVLEYTHPGTGGHVLPTMACYAQLIRPGERLKAFRRTGTAVYYVAQGQGATVIDGQEFVWQRGDVFAVPSWSLQEHANRSASEDAILFSIQDRPVLEAVNLFREEALEGDGHQAVTSAFVPVTA